jgi:tRNA U34 5-carboxymethylaminomethyl modifying GTPase MnmE/TrmE
MKGSIPSSIKNIVLFGQSGVGKSSVVNLMAGEERAKTSPGTGRCTMQWEEHSIEFDGCTYKVFDTVGLEEPQLGTKEYLETLVNAYDLIETLKQAGGIDLLLFCVRAGRFTSTIRNNYRLFYEWFCEKKVSIVLVLTGLEREQNMEGWWEKYKGTFDKYEIAVDGHACITAANGLDGRQQELYQLSRQLVRTLVRDHTRDRKESELKEGNELKENRRWFKNFGRRLKNLLESKHAPKEKEIVAALMKRCGMPRDAAAQLVGRGLFHIR